MHPEQTHLFCCITSVLTAVYCMPNDLWQYILENQCALKLSEVTVHMSVVQVVIVEEAGEVFEAHILASLAPTTEHLILIGDPEQLRPKPQLYSLQASFERCSA